MRRRSYGYSGYTTKQTRPSQLSTLMLGPRGVPNYMLFIGPNGSNIDTNNRRTLRRKIERSRMRRRPYLPG